MPTMKIKKGDLVKIMAGAEKGKTGKVLQVQPQDRTITIEGIGLGKRYLKRSQLNPQGGVREFQRPVAASKVALLQDKDTVVRIGYEVKKDGTKVRVARNKGNKEIK